MPTLFIHVNDGEPLVGEVDELPNPADQYILIKNPRQRDNKDLRYLMDEVTQLLLPWWRITYIEVMPTDEQEDIYLPYRD